MRILVAEDHREIRLWLVEALIAEGHEAVGVADGQEAYDLLLRDQSFGHIFSDNSMPRLDGYQLLQLWKASAFAHIPFTLMSAAGKEEIAMFSELARRNGATFYPKPFDTKKVFKELGLSRS